MNDTQWPRFQVFLQEKIGAPHQDVGSVHAPDQEMALLNARDVFVRRPECVSLWVVPARSIFTRTAQELEEQGIGEQVEETREQTAQPETFYVFCKAKNAGTQTLAGDVEAVSPQQALQKAVKIFSGERPPFAWFIFPARLALKSEPADIESMFSPALEKTFRLVTDFHTHSAMRQIKEQR